MGRVKQRTSKKTSRKVRKPETLFIPEYARPFIHADDFVIVTDRTGTVLYANEATAHRTGFELAEIIGRKPSELWGGQMDRTFYEAFWHRVLVEKKPFSGTVKNKRKDGTTFYVDFRAYPILDKSGNVEALISIEPDVTDQVTAIEGTQRALDRAKKSEKVLQAFIDEAADAIFVANLKGEYIDINKAACDLLGMRRADLLGKTIADLIPTSDIPRLKETRRRLLRPGVVEVSEWKLRHKSGRYIPVEVSAKIMPDKRWIAFVRDISDRSQASETLSALIHRAKSPVSAEKLLLELLAADMQNLSPLQRELINDLVETNAYTLELLKKILIASRVQEAQDIANKTELLDRIVERRIKKYQRTAAERRIKITCDQLGDCPRVPYIVSEIVDNLLSNAIKYSRAGGTVRVACDTFKDRTVFSVADSGVGIPKALQGSIFSPFFRAASDGTDASTGLGLYLSKRIAETLGFTLSFKSAPRKGTVFTLEMPVRVKL